MGVYQNKRKLQRMKIEELQLVLKGQRIHRPPPHCYPGCLRRPLWSLCPILPQRTEEPALSCLCHPTLPAGHLARTGHSTPPTVWVVLPPQQGFSAEFVSPYPQETSATTAPSSSDSHCPSFWEMPSACCARLCNRGCKVRLLC
jgi:hypothetical protein